MIIKEKGTRLLLFYKKPKTYRGYGDLFAVERFNIKLNLRQQI